MKSINFANLKFSVGVFALLLIFGISLQAQSRKAPARSQPPAPGAPAAGPAYPVVLPLQVPVVPVQQPVQQPIQQSIPQAVQQQPQVSYGYSAQPQNTSDMAGSAPAQPAASGTASGSANSSPDQQTACRLERGEQKALAGASEGDPCKAIASVEGNAPSAKDACGGQSPKSGSSKAQHPEYSMADHQAQQCSSSDGKPCFEAKDDKTDCSGNVCLSWSISGFHPFGKGGKDVSKECPTAEEWSKQADSECLKVVSDKTDLKAGDAVCGAGEGGGHGHCVMVESVGGGQVETHNVSDVVCSEARGSAAGWGLFPASSSLSSSKIASGTHLRPKSPQEAPNCWTTEADTKNEQNVEKCPQLASKNSGGEAP